MTKTIDDHLKELGERWKTTESLRTERDHWKDRHKKLRNWLEDIRDEQIIGGSSEESKNKLLIYTMKHHAHCALTEDEEENDRF